MSGKWSHGKGDRYRPVDRKRYNENWRKIMWDAYPEEDELVLANELDAPVAEMARHIEYWMSQFAEELRTSSTEDLVAIIHMCLSRFLALLGGSDDRELFLDLTHMMALLAVMAQRRM
jgi:hypothetical protein